MVIDVWVRRLKEILEKNNMDVYLLLKYVDGVNIMVSVMNEGMMWKVLAKKQEEVKSLKRPNK